MIQDMAYFETLDVESTLRCADHHRKDLLSELNDLYALLSDTGHAPALNSLIVALEGIDETFDDIWAETSERQDYIEDAHPTQILALTA